MPQTKVLSSMIRQATARLLGRTTAGTGDTEEITVGAGLSLTGGALSSLALGYGQTWQNMTGSRALGTNYTNTTGRSILVAAQCGASPLGGQVQALVDGVSVAYQGTGALASGSSAHTVTFVVPPGSTYRVNDMGFPPSSSASGIIAWAELR